MGAYWSQEEIDELCYTEHHEKLERELLDKECEEEEEGTFKKNYWYWGFIK